METHSNSIPGQCLEQKSCRNAVQSRKLNDKGPALQRSKRVFGTAQNPNVPLNAVSEKPKKKTSSMPLEKVAKPSQRTQIQSPSPIVPWDSTAKISDEKMGTRPKKKSVCFQERESKQGDKISAGGRVLEPHTPAKSPSVVTKPRRSGTPYYSADKCSKCRFDRLETSAYWLSQIKLAESVGKHFASVAFFRLGYESKAEPLRNLKVELSKYLGRHEYLHREDEWSNLTTMYGLAREEKPKSSEGEDAGAVEEKEKDLVKEVAKEMGTDS